MNYLLRGILNFGIFSLFQRYQHLKAFKVHIKGAKMATKKVLELDNRRWALWIVCATTNHGNISIMSYYIICQCLYQIICFNRKKPCQALILSQAAHSREVALMASSLHRLGKGLSLAFLRMS